MSILVNGAEHREISKAAQAAPASPQARYLTVDRARAAAPGNAATTASGVVGGKRLTQTRQIAPVSKSAFGVELGKMLGDSTGVRGGVSSTYSAATGVPPKLKKIKQALAPAKAAMIAAAKK